MKGRPKKQMKILEKKDLNTKLVIDVKQVKWIVHLIKMNRRTLR